MRRRHSITPIISLKGLLLFGLVILALLIYAVSFFYYKYSDDIFTKDLTNGQLFRLTIYALGYQLSYLIIPVLFFGAGLVYRSFRKCNERFLDGLKRDSIVLLLIGGFLWYYYAYAQVKIDQRFFAMLFDVQMLGPDEKLPTESDTYDLMGSPDLSEMHQQIDTLDVQIKGVENTLMDMIVTQTPTSELDKVVSSIDFGTTSITTEDVLSYPGEWDGIDRDTRQFTDRPIPMIRFIESLLDQQERYQDEIRLMHLSPIFVVLFLLLGMNLGYLLPFHSMATLGILIGVGYAWYIGTTMLEGFIQVDYSNQSSVLLGKISFLTLVNSLLTYLSIRIRPVQE